MFTETRLLDKVSYGSQFGHSYSTRIRDLKSGHERRNGQWSHPKYRAALLYQNLLEEDHRLVVSAHHACMGSLIGFRVKDWSDYKADSEVIGTGAGVEQELQLVKAYTFGPLQTVREIKKPVSGSVTIYEDGVPIAATVDTATGIVTVTAGVGSVVTWSGEFDVPMRFDSDDIDFDVPSRSGDSLILTGNVGLIEDPNA